jgi:hypothetical protein
MLSGKQERIMQERKISQDALNAFYDLLMDGKIVVGWSVRKLADRDQLLCYKTPNMAWERVHPDREWVEAASREKGNA